MHFYKSLIRLNFLNCSVVSYAISGAVDEKDVIQANARIYASMQFD